MSPITDKEIVVIMLSKYGKLCSMQNLSFSNKTIQNNNFELVDFRTHAGERNKENAIASVNDLIILIHLASRPPLKHKKHLNQQEEFVT
jgi:hypothetical protein